MLGTPPSPPHAHRYLQSVTPVLLVSCPQCQGLLPRLLAGCSCSSPSSNGFSPSSQSEQLNRTHCGSCPSPAPSSPVVRISQSPDGGLPRSTHLHLCRCSVPTPTGGSACSGLPSLNRGSSSGRLLPLAPLPGALCWRSGTDALSFRVHSLPWSSSAMRPSLPKLPSDTSTLFSFTGLTPSELTIFIYLFFCFSQRSTPFRAPQPHLCLLPKLSRAWPWEGPVRVCGMNVHANNERRLPPLPGPGEPRQPSCAATGMS